MKVRASILTPSVARGIARACAAAFVANAHIAHAGINVWTSHGPEVAPILALAIDPITPATIYAATNGSVFKSADSAMSWQTTGLNNHPEIGALAIDPTPPGRLYASIRGFGAGGGVFVSTDGASSWQAASHSPDSRALAIDPATPSTLYAGTGGCFEGFCVGSVFKSTDGAINWQEVKTGLLGNAIVSGLAIDPRTPSTLYVATLANCGETSCGADGGVYKSTDGANSWLPANAGLPEHRSVSALAIDPATPSTLYAGMDEGVFKSTDGANNWVSSGELNGHVYALAIDPSTPSTLYAGTRDGVFKSTNSASSWQASHAGFPELTAVLALAIDPITPVRLYAGTESGVFDIEQVASAHVVGTGTAASCTDAALDTALAGGGMVTFDCGADPVTIDISTGTGTKTIAAGTTIDGGGLITISGGNSVGVFSVSSGVNFVVDNLTLANGHALAGGDGSYGGGIHNEGSLNIVNSSFTGNFALFGGGIANMGNGRTLTVTNSTFTGNSAYGGSGIYNQGSLTVTNSTFTGNLGDSHRGEEGIGGGIFNGGGRITVANSTFTANSAGGGGIANGYGNNGGGTLTVTSSTFTENSGGGIVNGYGGALTVANSTFTGNNGGGILNGGNGTGTLTVTNTTITSNSGGGIVNFGEIALLRNTILASSLSESNCAGQPILDGGHNLDDGTSCGFSTANDSLSNTDPQLDPAGLQNNGGPTETLALCTAVDVPAGCTAASPAIDAGDQAVCAAAPVYDRDQRGFVRPGAGNTQCSIGACEADATVPEACAGDCSGTQIVGINDLITLVNIDLGNAEPSACPNGIPGGGQVDIALLIRAVNNALTGCASGQ